jgi:hypothetical protein
MYIHIRIHNKIYQFLNDRSSRSTLPSSPLSRQTSPKKNPTINISENDINKSDEDNGHLSDNNDNDQELLQLLSHIRSSPVNRTNALKRSFPYEDVEDNRYKVPPFPHTGGTEDLGEEPGDVTMGLEVICIYICVYVYVCMYIYTFIHIYIYMHK